MGVWTTKTTSKHAHVDEDDADYVGDACSVDSGGPDLGRRDPRRAPGEIFYLSGQT